MRPYYQDDLGCACGCGETPATGRRFVTGHNLRVLERTAEHRAAISAAQRRVWATRRSRKPLGSTRLDANGYVLVKVVHGGGRWDKEHVLVVERGLGRRLDAGEEVHHINGRRTDNRPENLYLTSTAGHIVAEASFRLLKTQLIESGVVSFNRDTGRYELCR